MALNPLFGRAIGINMDKLVLSDSQRSVKDTAVIYAGRPVALDSNSLVVDYGNDATSGGAGNVRISGLARANKNAFVNEASGSFGMFGSGQIDIAIMGIATLKANVFSSTSDSNVDLTKPTFDESLTYAVGDSLWVDQGSDATKRGLINNVKLTSGAAQNDNTFVGYVVRPPSASDSSMTILLLPK